MRKLLLLISIVLLLGVMTFVMAEMPASSVVRTEKGTTWDFVSGCYPNTGDGCINYLGIRTHFKLYKGWNLVPNSGEGVQSPRTSCASNQNDFSTTYIKYLYFYFPSAGYIGGKIDSNSGNLADASVQQKFMNQVNLMGQQNYLYYATPRVSWVYSENSCEFELATNFYNDLERSQFQLDKVKLNQGWNMIYLHPLLINHKLNDVIGDCQIESANVWNPVNQAWDLTGSQSTTRVNDLLNTEINEENVYMPLLLKVTNDCTFGTSVTNPPALPEGSSSSTCTDSDGGKNYQLKGSITGKYTGTNQDVNNIEDVCTLNKSLTGSCSGNSCKLVEYFCDNGYVNLEEHSCSNGCNNGVCI